MKKKYDIYVAIASSSGGFDALMELVTYIPKNLGIYCFIAQHNALEQKSILAELLNRKSKIISVAVTLDTEFEKDILYVIPPELKIEIQNNKPIVKTIGKNAKHPLPNADELFENLSKIKDAKTIGIVLSGTGTDGTIGMQHIKEVHGVSIAQMPQEAEFDSMPQSVVDSGVADYILYLDEMFKKISSILPELKIGKFHCLDNSLNDIVKYIKEYKHLDLSKYKEETVHRRILKQMNNLAIEDINKYANYLSNNEIAIDELISQMLIGVTEFFRGTQAFEILSTKIKKYLLKKEPYSEIRVWIVACSSGEEAYSFAILLNEICEEIGKKFHIKIFASDLDEGALQKAKLGSYNKQSVEKLDKNIIQKYFIKTQDNYTIIQKLREQIVFAQHNFLNNPPFINLDFISCRNVLIYLKLKVQNDVLAMFHYSLVKEGILFLGSSESITNSNELFNTLDTKARIFQKKSDLHLQPLFQSNISKYTQKLYKDKGSNMKTIINSVEIEKYLKESLFEYLTNGNVIVDDKYNIIYKKGSTPYIVFSDGITSLNLFDNLDKHLHYEARDILKKVFLSNIQDVSKFVQIESNEQMKFVQITAKPLQMSEHKSLILLIFNEIDLKDLIIYDNYLPNIPQNKMINALTSQVAESREQVENISQELNISKQNMATLNEELQDSNEKLQSTVEELETSNEELQSSNEELKISIDTIKEVQNKLSLILESSMDGILGLDTHGKHTFVNEKAAKILGYSVEYLLGKDSHSIWHHTKPDGSFYPESECPIMDVLQKGVSHRGEDLFWKKDGTSFPVEFVRSPIIQDDEIIGALVSFHDISQRKLLHSKISKDKQVIQQLSTKFELTFQHAQIGIAHIDLDGSWLDVNRYFCDIVGYTKKELLKLNFTDITHPDDVDLDLAFVKQLLNGELDKYTIQKRYIHKNGNVIWINLSVILLRDEQKQPLYFISIVQDITQLKTLMLELEVQRNEFKTIIHFAPNPIMIFSEDGNIILMNKAFNEITGYRLSDIGTISKWCSMTNCKQDILNVKNIDALFKNNEPIESEQLFITNKYNKELLWISSIAPLLHMHNSKRVLIFSAMDITTMHKNEELMLAQSRQAAMGDMIGMIAHQWRQPLSVISMIGNNLRSDLDLNLPIDNENLYNIAKSLNEQTKFLSHIIDDFRNFLKPQKEKKYSSLCEVFNKLENMIGKTLENNDIKLIFINNCDIKVNTYANELIQVLINLINNAKDAYKEKENILDAKIKVTTLKENNSTNIVIQDYAGGIDKEIINKLGEPYVSTKSKNGTGLGIYMSKMILEKHFNGTLTWKNIDGGSCFTISLPLE